MSSSKRSRNKHSDSEILTKKCKIVDTASNDECKYDLNPSSNVLYKPPDCASGEVKSTRINRLLLTFYNQPGKKLARSLIGCTLVRRLDNGTEMRARIVETEAYVGVEDKAAHSYQGKRTNRNEAMFMEPGTLYVYSIYGMFHCANISSQGDGCAVLLRALEPITGLDLMMTNRKSQSRSKKPKLLHSHQVCNGPSKLCIALDIAKSDLNKEDLCSSDKIWLEEGDRVSSNDVISCARINIGYAADWVDKPLRFYIKDNKSVSVRDKRAEMV